MTKKIFKKTDEEITDSEKTTDDNMKLPSMSTAPLNANLTLKDKFEIAVMGVTKKIPPFRYIFSSINATTINIINIVESINSIGNAVYQIAEEVHLLRESHNHIMNQITSGSKTTSFPGIDLLETKDEDKPN